MFTEYSVKMQWFANEQENSNRGKQLRWAKVLGTYKIVTIKFYTNSKNVGTTWVNRIWKSFLDFQENLDYMDASLKFKMERIPPLRFFIKVEERGESINSYVPTSL